MILRVGILVAAAMMISPACAQLFKCVAKDGKVAYQSEPCPASVNEQRLRAQPGGPSGNSASSSMKEGWNEEKRDAMRNGCVRDAYDGGKRGWERAGGNPRDFPEVKARETVDKYCACVMRRITSSLTFSEFSSNPVGPLSDAVYGDECGKVLSTFDER